MCGRCHFEGRQRAPRKLRHPFIIEVHRFLHVVADKVPHEDVEARDGFDDLGPVVLPTAVALTDDGTAFVHVSPWCSSGERRALTLAFHSGVMNTESSGASLSNP